MKSGKLPKSKIYGDYNDEDNIYVKMIPIKQRIKQRKQKIVYFKIFDAKFDVNYLKDTLRIFG